MANKRMFSKQIVGSDAFLDMPSTSQLLYFHLGMEADDDGFLGNPKRVQRFIGSSDDDMKVLTAKRFIIIFSSGVLVVKHHRINNNWDKYNCKRTAYLEEFSQLYLKENMAYTLDSSKGVGLQSAPRLKTVFRREENRGEEKRIDKTQPAQSAEEGEDSFIKFWEVYPRKVGKADALRAWKKLRPSQLLSQKIIDSVFTHVQSEEWKRERGRFIPHPATYLNQGRWDDEVAIQSNKVYTY